MACWEAALPAAYAWCVGIPQPQIHDEFSYLLAADTYAHGRLTNPSPELPEFFEAEHVLLVPTYMAKYPPGQGLVMAIGQVAIGMSVFGVWFSCGVFAASLYWMLLGWTSARWAMATTLSVMLIHIASYWCQSYWGGMVAASGGGAAVRRAASNFASSANVFEPADGFGDRGPGKRGPFEGLLACLPVAAVMAWWLAMDPTVGLQRKVLLWVVPVSATCCAGAAALAIDNQAVTGSWWELPYILHQRQYYPGGVSRFSGSWVPSRIPCERIVRFYNPLSLKETIVPSDALRRQALQRAGRMIPSIRNETLGSRKISCTRNGIRKARQKAPCAGTKRRSFGPDRRAFVADLFAAGAEFHSVRFYRNRDWRFAVGGTGCRSGFRRRSGRGVEVQVGPILLVDHGCLSIGRSTVWAWFPHYAAPVLPLLYGAVAIALRRLGLVRGTWLPPRSIRPAMLVGVVLVVFLVNHGESIARQTFAKVASPAQTMLSTGHTTPRSSVLQYLRNRSGIHLVFVRYSAGLFDPR